jgi:ribosomal 30S subunit maturation factor RimM
MVSEFAGCTVQAEIKSTGTGSTLNDLSLVGYTLLDSTGNIRGTIKSVAERKHQWLATITNISGSEFLLPVHEDLILDSNRESKTITMIIPDGIEDLS